MIGCLDLKNVACIKTTDRVFSAYDQLSTTTINTWWDSPLLKEGGRHGKVSAPSRQKVDQLISTSDKRIGNYYQQSDHSIIHKHNGIQAAYNLVTSESDPKMMRWPEKGHLFIQKFPGENKKAHDAVLFLHGFPADSGKNEDIAEKIKKKDAFIFHYAGLGNSSGVFSFYSSIQDAIQLSKILLRQYSKLHLVGHSWGGLVCLNIIRELVSLKLEPSCLGQIALLAPFSKFTDDLTFEQEVEKGLRDFIESRKQLRHESANNYSVETLTRDLEFVKKACSPIDFISSIPFRKDQLTIIQGTKDEVVLPADTRQLVSRLPLETNFIEVDDNHWFRDRASLLELIEQALRIKDASVNA